MRRRFRAVSNIYFQDLAPRAWVTHASGELAYDIDPKHVSGCDRGRNYWMRQRTTIDPHVEPPGFSTGADRAIVAKVHQIVRSQGQCAVRQNGQLQLSHRTRANLDICGGAIGVNKLAPMALTMSASLGRICTGGDGARTMRGCFDRPDPSLPDPPGDLGVLS